MYRTTFCYTSWIDRPNPQTHSRSTPHLHSKMQPRSDCRICHGFCRMAHSALRQCCFCGDHLRSGGPSMQAATHLSCGHSFCFECVAASQPCQICYSPFPGSTATSPEIRCTDQTGTEGPEPASLTNLLARIGVSNAESMQLPPEALTLGELLSTTGNSCLVYRGLLHGLPASPDQCTDLWKRHI